MVATDRGIRMKLDSFADLFSRRLGMKTERLSGYFSRNIGETATYDVVFAAFGIEDRHLYSIEAVAVGDGAVRFSVDRQRRLSEVGHQARILSTEGFPSEEIEIPLRDGDSVKSVFEMAVAATHFGARDGDLNMVDDEHMFARAYRAVKARMPVPPSPSAP
jgi:hypothetical protein